MTSVCAAVLAGGALWCLLAPAGPWPWRVGELAPAPSRRGRRRRVGDPVPAPPRGARRPGAGSSLHRVTRRRTRRSPEPSDLVEVIDRLQVAVSAGHSLHTAVAAVAGIGSGPTTAAMARVAEQVARGGRLGDALGALADELGAAATPLVAVLSTSLQSGAPPGPALQRLADAERRRRRRRAERRVRRLPVLLLAPLVGLVLPSFVVVTIVPVAATTARAGLLPASP